MMIKTECENPLWLEHWTQTVTHWHCRRRHHSRQILGSDRILSITDEKERVEINKHHVMAKGMTRLWKIRKLKQKWVSSCFRIWQAREGWCISEYSLSYSPSALLNFFNGILHSSRFLGLLSQLFQFCGHNYAVLYRYDTIRWESGLKSKI